MRSLKLSLLFLPLVVACASSGGAGAGTSSSPNLLTAEDLAGVVDLTTLDAIRRLRPNWLRSRAAMSPESFQRGGDTPAVRLDGVISSGLDQLQDLPVRDVQEISFLSAADATTLYGTGYVNGIIQVRTRER
jgi:hypothetical protein